MVRGVVRRVWRERPSFVDPDLSRRCAEGGAFRKSRTYCRRDGLQGMRPVIVLHAGDLTSAQTGRSKKP